MISRLILVHPDPKLRESLRYGFEREGIQVTLGADAAEAALFAEPAELVIAGGRSGDEGSAILGRIRDAMAASGAPAAAGTPVLYVGNGIGRTQALAGGASEFLGEPVYLRDAVTAARLLAGRKRDNPAILTGELGEHFGLFYLVRAVSALGRRGVLTLVRGMRRGELRFYDGEVTSAQVGFLHGLAALHQLLLWTEGRFEFRPEDVVRRQQIPLDPPALFADAERFLSEICAAAGRLSPSACYERDAQQLARVSGRIPPEVGEVLQLFDGSRTVADVVEDSPFRVFETLRIANRLAELGLVRLRAGSGPRSQRARAPLAIDEWLVGDRPAASAAPTHRVVARPELPAAQAGQGGHRSRKERRKNKRGVRGGGLPDRRKPQPSAASPGAPLVVDWAQILPAAGSDHPVSGVVPSSVAAGEIGAASASAMPPAAPVAAPAPESPPVGASPRGAPPVVSPVAARSPGAPPVAASAPGSPPVAGWTPSTPPVVSPVAAAPATPAKADARARVAPAAKPTAAAPAKVAVTPPGQPIVPSRNVDAPAPPRSRARSSAPPPAREAARGADGFSASEEAFFARGAELAGSAEAGADDFTDLDEGQAPPQSFWRRLFRSATSYSEPPRKPPRRRR